MVHSHRTCHIAFHYCHNYLLNLMIIGHLIHQSCIMYHSCLDATYAHVSATLAIFWLCSPGGMFQNFPHAHPFFSLSGILSCTFLLLCCSSYAFPRCPKYQSVKTKTYQGLGCSILSLATGIPSRGCLSRTQPEALGLCCLWTSRLLHIRALLGPTHIPSRGCLWSRTQPRLCCLWTRACFSRGCLWSRTQLGLCCLWTRACYMSRPVLGQKHLVGHTLPSSMLFCQLLAPSPLQAQLKSLCVVRADVNAKIKRDCIKL